MDMAKPKIRFKGYTDDWEQRKLGDMMDVTSVKRIRQSDWTDSGVRFLRARDIVAESKNEEVSEPLFISQEKYDEYSEVSGKVEKGDLLVTGVGTIGVPMLINSEEPLYFKDGNIIWFKNKNAIDGRFFYHLFNGLNVQKFIKESAGTGTVGTYTIENGKKTPINLPLRKEEQEKIGEYFSNLDHLITLHQRKCEETKKLKKYMLQKMFPQNGQTVPEIRFAGFTDAWEQRKLNEIADKVTEKNKNNKFSEPFTNSAEQGIISQKDYFDREIVNDENLNGYYIVRKDDFIYNPRISVTAPVGPINRNRLGRNGVISPLYTVFRTHDIDNLYLEFYFKTTKWHRFMKLNGDSGARFDRFTISSTQFMEMPIPYPTLEEQRKIGAYFESLDTLITLHQHKYEQLQSMKKFMLQNMFV